MGSISWIWQISEYLMSNCIQTKPTFGSLVFFIVTNKRSTFNFLSQNYSKVYGMMNIWVLSHKYDKLMKTSYLITFKLNQHLDIWFYGS